MPCQAQAAFQPSQAALADKVIPLGLDGEMCKSAGQYLYDLTFLLLSGLA